MKKTVGPKKEREIISNFILRSRSRPCQEESSLFFTLSFFFLVREWEVVPNWRHPFQHPFLSSFFLSFFLGQTKLFFPCWNCHAGAKEREGKIMSWKGKKWEGKKLTWAFTSSSLGACATHPVAEEEEDKKNPSMEVPFWVTQKYVELLTTKTQNNLFQSLEQLEEERKALLKGQFFLNPSSLPPWTNWKVATGDN